MLAVNKAYFIHFFEQHFSSRRGEATALDFGCGKGDVVRDACARGYRFCGLESHYGTECTRSNYQHYPPPDLPAYIYLYNGHERFPFEDGSFDFIFSNQVFEHIEHLDNTLNELYRILKPGGLMIHNFPSREYIIEGHSGIPWVHRIRNRRRREQVAWLWFHLRLGVKAPAGTNYEAWVHDILDFIERYCFYRPECVMRHAFQQHFRVRRGDKGKLLYHLAAHASPTRRVLRVLVALTPARLINLVEKRRGSITFICEKLAECR